MYEAEEIFERKGLGGSSHGSTIAEGSDGTLYAAWYSGTREKAADVGVFMSRKLPGRTWDEPRLVEKEGVTSRNPFIEGTESPEELEELESEETSEGNPVLFADWNSGRLWLFWVTMRGAGEHSGWSACVIKCKDSTDWGHTWSEPRLVRDNIGWMTRNKPVWLSNGDWLWPVMAEFGKARSMFYRSTRDELAKGAWGWSWREPDAFIEGGVIQPTVVETSPGNLTCFMRTNARTTNCPNLVAVSRSSDYGHSWTEIRPTRDELPNPDSGLDAVQLQSGSLLLVCNPRKEGRQQLSVLLSEDGGETFPVRRDLEPVEGDKSYSYPAVIQARDGSVHVTYTNRRLNIKHARFDEAWVRGVD
ncbi:MAG: sialidase family protein [Promethearchaeota archaeon]